jgi:spermidine/putrescine transport system permease protein
MRRSRLSAWLVTVPPFAWIALFLFVPYCLLFCYSFWSLDANQQVLRHWTFANYLHLATTPLYLTVILRSMRIAFSVVLLSLLIGYPLACFLVFQAAKYRRMLYQAVIIPLWISYLVRAYAWKVIFGNEARHQPSSGLSVVQPLCRDRHAHPHLRALCGVAGSRVA